MGAVHREGPGGCLSHRWGRSLVEEGAEIQAEECVPCLFDSTPRGPEAHYRKKWLLVSKPKKKKKQKDASRKASGSSSKKKKRGQASEPDSRTPSDPNPRATKKPKQANT